MEMHSFNSDLQSHFYLSRGDDKNGADFAELLQSAGIGINCVDSADISGIFSMYNGIRATSVSSLQFGGVPNSLGSSGVSGQLAGGRAVGKDGSFENSRVVADRTHRKETPPHNQDEILLSGVGLIAGDSTDQSKGRFRGQKELLKLAQNREAARKSRMRKKAYVKQLESSEQKLLQLERACSGGQRQSSRVGLGGMDADQRRWEGEHERLMDDLRASLRSREREREVRLLVDAAVSHYEELFRMKSSSDMFHILSGMWATPVERWFMWLGGFRSSDLLKVLEKEIQPVSVEQLVGICNLQQSCHQTEDALSQGMEALQHSLLHTLSRAAGNVADYATHMATAITNIQAIQNFLNQADLLRLHTLQHLQRILTPCQAARALLAINDYNSRLRALSSLWLARPNQ